ncbi:uncharacterized protein L203_106166 [Cryptococcus depauperatus CBS 7841]|uniref:FAS1 domain-containing protein n=1 Tax=Cryptococcus depauperatus CBS 7841 TaxID=1295531 RepID=A0AAJ8JYI2_9TREE
MVYLPALVLLPLALGAPAHRENDKVPGIFSSLDFQTAFGENIRHLSSWSWNKAGQVIDELEAYGGLKTMGEEDDTGKTIWQRLNDDPHSFSKLVKIMEFEGHALEFLKDQDLQITFFAPNNDALKCPHKHHDHDDSILELLQSPSLSTLSAFMDKEPTLIAADDDDDDDDKDKRHKKEVIRKIAAIKLNFYAKIVASDRKASNGYFHAIDHPLLPPGSIFDETFLFPDCFSTLTSAVQKLNQRHTLDWGYDHEHSKPGKLKFHGTPLATLFAPTNSAFLLLPPKLKFYLFSPFGEKALGKLLAYHYILDTLLLSETLHVAKHRETEVLAEDGDDPSFYKELKIETALPNATITVEIEKKKLLPIEGFVKTTIKVNGDYVKIIDVPARNGAFHVIDKLLVPPHHCHDHGIQKQDIANDDAWNNWEQWLPQWANEA